jgi:hypothetical protein
VTAGRSELFDLIGTPIVTGGPDIDLTCCDADAREEWSLTSRNGVVMVGAGAAKGPTLEVGVREGSLSEVIFGSTAGWIAAERTEFRSAEFGWAPAPPFDTTLPRTSDEFDTFVVQHSNYASPFGTLNYFDTFVGKVLVARTGGRTPKSEVVVRNSFRAAVDVWDPTLDLRHGAQHAEIHGREVGQYLALAGLYDQRCVREMLGHRTAVNRRIADLADHLASNAWRSVAGRIDPVGAR